jgi:5-methylcytosine-specific restriction endonuclease McrA
VSAYGYQYRLVRARVLADAEACTLCGGTLDFDAPPRSRYAPSVDHIFPVHHTRQMEPEERLRLLTDPDNLRPVHYGCNSRRGKRRATRPRHISRDWI